jgi:hypothetical protein
MLEQLSGQLGAEPGADRTTLEAAVPELHRTLERLGLRAQEPLATPADAVSQPPGE